MTIAALDHFHSRVLVLEVSKGYINSMYDGDVIRYFVEEHNFDPDNTYVMSDVEHLDILLHFK